MEYLTTAFNAIKSIFRSKTNLEEVGTYHYEPKPPRVNEIAIENHKRTLMVAFKQHLTDAEIKTITVDYRRSDINEESILDDFFANDVEKHDIPFDIHTERGLDAMTSAFRPPQKCMPAHLNDVEHHYPYKWQVNSEAPFSTDKYFLLQRKTYGDFYDQESQTWKHYVNPTDMQRRIPQPIEQTLKQVTPPKFGFQKQAIFSWVRRWHHIIKSNFTDLTDLASSAYVRDRFIFPMLLHTKTAIVKAKDPNKMRTIWGVSKTWIIADTMFYWELMAYYKLNPGKSPMLWSYETFTGGWFRLNQALFNGYIRNSFITLDWKRFDKRAYFSLIHLIMGRVRTYLDFSKGYLPNELYPDTSEDWSEDKARKLEYLFLWTLECLFTSPIVLPDGRMFKRRFAGIPSGLFTTQLLDSWYNYTMLATLLSALGFDPNTCIIKVQGDDSIIRLYVLIPPDSHDKFLLRMQELADYYFKAVISTEKSELNNQLTGCEVLSYRNTHGLPSRDEILMLAQFYHTKAKDPEPEITMAQAIGFAYAACGNNLRVHSCLEEIYLYYKRQGYTPNPAGFAVTFGDSPDLPTVPFSLDYFPTIEEVRQFFLNTTYHNEAQKAKTWPKYFIYPPCERP